ncbi:MAG TPA: hypothetical protein DCS07_15205 [Bdellovibrionales bacterium]|nr:MAG: hypothetical protein A2X97_06425 [Bdellovibrionales bacterium GWA1_52_35]OFZ43531.1 MAG: hypothetical protein A2070_00230 [Bdellovibrionales bacterium GWC1_52_8]HAR43958.1 hypothetical protein [Bdellovibrionales bacterium]HCM40874.1 hypothetical protein [Bdellovibrionales bacterium]
MCLKRAWLFGLLVLSSTPAHAIVPAEVTTVNAEVPQTRISRADALGGIGTARSQLSIGVSSWKPEAILLPTYREEAVTLARDGLPMSFVQNCFSLGAYKKADLTGVVGMGFLSLKRAQSNNAEQSIALMTGILGVELAPANMAWSYGRAHFGLGVLPMLALASRSSVSESTSAMAFPAEISTGVFFGRQSGLDLSLSRVIGRSEVIQTQGLAFRAALKFDI